MRGTPDESLRAAFAPARALEPRDEEIAAILDRAGAHRHGKRPGRKVVGLALVATLVGAAVAGAATGILPVGAELPVVSVKGDGEPRYASERVVVATGKTAIAGRWQASVTESDQGLCISLELVDAYPGTRSESCGSTPDGFDVASFGGGSRLPDTTIVYGHTPEDAATVRATSAAGLHESAGTHDGPPDLPGNVYVLEIPRTARNVQASWIDEDGQAASPDINVPSTIDHTSPGPTPERPR
jgi:hypothetical protein